MSDTESPLPAAREAPTRAHVGGWPVGHPDLARKTRQIHRKRFWGRVRFRVLRVFMRPLCLPRRHAFWERDTMLTAMASGRSKRCRWCNRLVVKREFRIAP